MTTEPPSKTNSSWPPTMFTYAIDGGRSSGALAQHRARSSSLFLWNGEALMLMTSLARHRLGRRAGRWAPRVLAHADADHALGGLDRGCARSRREVAIFVEHAVVRQQLLAVDGQQRGPAGRWRPRCRAGPRPPPRNRRPSGCRRSRRRPCPRRRGWPRRTIA